jgi:RNA polymerase-binding protein DksA
VTTSDGGPRALLEAARRDAEARIQALRADHARFVAASVASNADDEHDPEGATIAFEREQVAALLVAAERALADASAALARLDAGDYGTCEECERPIGAPRLEARPTARTCIDCASRSGRR